MMPLPLDQQSDGKQGGSRQPKVAPRGLAVERPKSPGVDAVAQNRHLLRRSPELQHRLSQSGTHGDQPVRLCHRPTDQPAGNGVTGQLTYIRSARGQNHRTVEPLAQQHRSDPVGIEIVRVDRVELQPRCDQPFDETNARAVKQQGRQGHPELRDDHISGMVDREAVPIFPPLHRTEPAPAAETTCEGREIGHRRDDRAFSFPARDQMREPVRDENPVIGIAAIRKQGREGEKPDWLHRGRASVGLGGGPDRSSGHLRRPAQSPVGRPLQPSALRQLVKQTLGVRLLGEVSIRRNKRRQEFDRFLALPVFVQRDGQVIEDVRIDRRTLRRGLPQKHQTGFR